jgi:hypothetical protein
MIWQAPAGLAALALLAAPLLVHLLARRRAARVLFPGMRFVPPGRPAAVRLRTPSDLPLLMVRLAAVAAAVLACAQPILLSAARQRAWSSRVARAVVLDTSPSVPTDTATPSADQQALGVYASHRFTGSDLRDALRRAVDWLETIPAGQREIAIVSDFQNGALEPGDLLTVPSAIGISPVRAGLPRPSGTAGSIDGWRGGRWEAAVALDGRSTQVTWIRSGESPPADGLTILAAGQDRAAAARAAEAAQSFGVPVPARPRPIEIRFAGAENEPGSPPVTPWIASAAIALRVSPLLAGTGAVVAAGERRGVMTVSTPLSARSALAPAVIRAAVLSAAPPLVDAEADPSSIDDRTLARMGRRSTPIAAPRPTSDESDGRWLWGFALGLLLAEGSIRRRMAAGRAKEVHASAA